MDHPAVFLDSRCVDAGDVDAADLSVLAISEMGICYFWYGRNVEELRNSKPTKVSLSLDDPFFKSQKGAVPTIFAAKLQGIAKPASGHIFLAYGLPIKPSFEKILVHSGTDIRLNSSSDGLLLPITHSSKSKRGPNKRNEVSALDRANAEDAVLPMPTFFDLHQQKKGNQNSIIFRDEVMADDFFNSKQGTPVQGKKDDFNEVGDTPTVCMEDRLRTLGILDNKDDLTSDTLMDSMKLRRINIEATLPQRKMRAAILSMAPCDAYKQLEVLVAMWQSRSCSGKYVLPWICCTLANHSNYVISQEPVTQLLYSLDRLTKSRGASIHSLLQLSGRLQLVTAQIDKAVQNEGQSFLHDQQTDESEDDGVDDVLYGEEDEESQSSDDEDD